METEVRKQYEKLTKYLIQNNLSITTMESCTSGQVASLITDTEGASAILKGAFVTYSNVAKIMQGVPKEVIDQYGVYSKETAYHMAVACKEAYKANIGIGVTGSMGNVDPNNHDSIPGEVYFAIDLNGDVFTFHVSLSPQKTRLEYKLLVASKIVNEIFKILEI